MRVTSSQNHVTSSQNHITSSLQHVTSSQHNVTSSHSQHHVAPSQHHVTSSQHHVTSAQHSVKLVLYVISSDQFLTAQSGGISETVGLTTWLSVIIPATEKYPANLTGGRLGTVGAEGSMKLMISHMSLLKVRFSSCVFTPTYYYYKHVIGWEVWEYLYGFWLPMSHAFHFEAYRGGANGEMANLTNEKGKFAIAIFRHFSPFFAIFRHW